MSRLTDALGARIADERIASKCAVSRTRSRASKRRLKTGGLLRSVKWGQPGEPDVRGRRRFAYTSLDAVIEQLLRPDAGPHATLATDRADDTVLTILDPVAITDEHLFRWGSPSHTYRIKQVDGVVQDEETGTRFFSEVVVIR